MNLKSVLFGVLMFTFFNFVGAQVPEVVRKNFKRDFPKAIDIEWEKEDGSYMVEFELKDTLVKTKSEDLEAIAEYNSKGEMLQFMQEINVLSLPLDAQKKMQSYGYIPSKSKCSRLWSTPNITEFWVFWNQTMYIFDIEGQEILTGSKIELN
jgi:hypothetical protein